MSDRVPDGATRVTRFSTDDGGKGGGTVDSTQQQPDKERENVACPAVDGGDPVDSAVDEGIDAEPEDLVSAALAGARRIARSGSRRGRGAAGKATRRENLAGRRRGGYSAPGPDPDRDPQAVGAILGALVGERGWERPLADARVFADWPALVGPDVAAHCTPQALHEGELRIAAESTAWATQLRLLAGTLLARLVAELGPQVVTKLAITGPVAPSWKHGGRSVHGARGPRDTYG